MNRLEDIRKICQESSFLSEKEIDKIIETAKAMDICAESFDYDIFIDVPSKQVGEAIVVYHGNANTFNSLYRGSPVGQKALRENEPGVIRTLETGAHTKNIKARTQENRYVIQNIHPIRCEGKVIGTIITEHDTNYDIRSDFNVQKNGFFELSPILDSMKNINNHLDDAILIFDKSGNLQFKNMKAEAIYKMLGYMEDIEGLHYDNLSLDGTTFREIMQRSIKPTNENPEVNIGNYYFLIKKVFIPEEELQVAVILHDITQIKNREAEIVLKTVAIGEIHHRIKNNLQTIASLLRLQSRRSSNSESKTLLKDSVNRILSIAATHELLSKQLTDNVCLLDVIQNVCNNIRRCYSDAENIQLDISANQNFSIDSDRATVIALIVNELVQNCYDHAFSNNKEGNIKVFLLKQCQVIIVEVQDNGSGFNNMKDTIKSLGLTIVKTYVEDKLNGSISFQSDHSGTNVTIKFDYMKK